jgi:hypothetical protein
MRVAESAFELHALISVAARAQRVVVRRIAEQRFIAAMRLLVSCDGRLDELARVSMKWVRADWIPAQELFRVTIPFRVVALLASARSSLSMRIAIIANANQSAAARLRARMWWLEWHGPAGFLFLRDESSCVSESTIPNFARGQRSQQWLCLLERRAAVEELLTGAATFPFLRLRWSCHRFHESNRRARSRVITSHACVVPNRIPPSGVTQTVGRKSHVYQPASMSSRAICSVSGDSRITSALDRERQNDSILWTCPRDVSSCRRLLSFGSSRERCMTQEKLRRFNVSFDGGSRLSFQK